MGGCWRLSGSDSPPTKQEDPFEFSIGESCELDSDSFGVRGDTEVEALGTEDALSGPTLLKEVVVAPTAECAEQRLVEIKGLILDLRAEIIQLAASIVVPPEDKLGTEAMAPAARFEGESDVQLGSLGAVSSAFQGYYIGE